MTQPVPIPLTANTMLEGTLNTLAEHGDFEAVPRPDGGDRIE